MRKVVAVVALALFFLCVSQPLQVGFVAVAVADDGGGSD